MKKFIAEYLKIIAYASIGLVFLFSSFYLLMNYYHSKEVSNPIYIGSSDENYVAYLEKLTKIKANLEAFKSQNSYRKEMHSKLTSCHKMLSGEDTLATLTPNNYYNSMDIYKLGSKFQTEILNVCWAIHLSYLTTDKVPNEFKTVAPYISNTIKATTTQVDSAISEIQNNSSYFYTTNITSATIRNYLKSDYELIASAYNEFADVILNLSENINAKEVVAND